MTRTRLVELLAHHGRMFAGMQKGRPVVGCSCHEWTIVADGTKDESALHAEHLADVLLADEGGLW